MNLAYGNFQPQNSKRIASFIAKTVDKIASPLEENEKVPEEIFDLRQLISFKMP